MTNLIAMARRLLLATAAAGAPAQAPAPGFELAATALAEPRAEFDLFGELRVSGKAADGVARTLTLRFAELRPLV
jgi:hypothetical protein